MLEFGDTRSTALRAGPEAPSGKNPSTLLFKRFLKCRMNDAEDD